MQELSEVQLLRVYLTRNYAIPQVIPHVIAQNHSLFLPSPIICFWQRLTDLISDIEYINRISGDTGDLA